MNQTFSLNRFTQLNRWFWAANGRTYSLGILALLIITTLLLGRVLIVSGYDANVARENVPYFIILSLVSISLLSCHIVSVLHDQDSALLFLMLPASRTEKFAVAILYFILFIVGYSLFYRVTESLFFQIANSRLPSTGNLYHTSLLDKPDERMKEVARMAYALLMTAIIGLSSSLHFRQGVFVKNTVLTLCLTIGLSVFYGYIMKAFFPGLETQTNYFLGDLYVFPKNQFHGAPKLPTPLFVKYIFPWFILTALWIAARIRFNEIER